MKLIKTWQSSTADNYHAFLVVALAFLSSIYFTISNTKFDVTVYLPLIKLLVKLLCHDKIFLFFFCFFITGFAHFARILYYTVSAITTAKNSNKKVRKTEPIRKWNGDESRS